MMLPVWAKLENNTERRTLRVMGTSLSISLMVYISTSFAGYSGFGPDVKSNLLLSFPQSTFVNVLQLLVSFKFMLALPFQLYPLGTSFCSLLEALSWLKPHRTPYVRTVVTIVAGGIVVAVSFFVTDLGIAFAFIGSLLSTVISYVIPAICWLTVGDGDARMKAMAVGLLLWAMVPPCFLISYYATL